MLKMRRVVLGVCVFMLFVAWGSKDAYAAEDVTGYKKAVTIGIINRVDTVDVEQYGIQRKNLSRYYYDAIYESPYCFIVNNPSYGYNGDDIVTYMKFDYKYTEAQVKNFYSKFNTEVNTIVSAAKNMTALEKILYVHDYFVANYCYDYASYEKYVNGNSGGIPDEHYTAIGVMVNKTGVCQGYALAFNYVMSKLGVESHMITSDSMNHAWNIVKLNGSYYHIDATWDDPVYDTAGKVEHDYFLVSDAKMKELGYSGYNKSLYPATNKKYDNMFWRNVKSAFTYYKNKWYYVGSDGVIYSYDVNKNTKKKIIDLPDKKWSVVGNSKQYYVGVFSTFRVHNGNLYFNTKSKIYKLNVSTKKATVAVSPSTKNGYIYGLAYVDGKVCYQLKTKPSAKGALYSCNQAVVVSANTYFNATKVCEMRDISTCVASGNVGIYTGKAVTPAMTIKCGGIVLVKNVDYTIKYSNNINLGKGIITVTGKGNYSGTKTFTFNIVLDQVKNLGTKSRSNSSIKIGWSKVAGAKEYWVYRYNASTGKYECIAKTTSNSYTNKSLGKNKTYYYKVVAVNGSNKGAASAQLKTYTSK